MGEIKVLERDPAKLLNLLANDVQELIALISEQQLMSSDSAEFNQALLLSSQLNMIRKIQDKTIFSVTGLQGAGKTTFVKKLYNLKDGILPIDAGRSESLPILITESKRVSTEEIIYKVRRSILNQTNIQCEFETKDEVISHQEFLEIARSPQIHDLWLDIEVPESHFGAGISLALLPGIEKDKLDRSQRDLEFMLSLSTSVIFVLNYRMLARKDQQTKIKDMIDRYKKYAPLFAISFSEDLSEADQAYYSQLLMDKFDIPLEEESRITFIGKSDLLQGWERNMVSSINRYGKVSHYSYRKQLTIIRELSIKALQLSDVIEEQIRMKRVEDEEKQTDILQSSEVLRAFFKEKRELVDTVEQTLQNELDRHASNCSRKMDEYLINQNQGLGKKVQYFFKGDQITLNDKVTFREKTMELWNEKDKQASESIIMKVLNENFESQATELGFTSPEQIEKRDEVGIDNPFRVSLSTPATSSAIFRPVAMDGPQALERLMHYLNPGATDESIQLQKEDLRVLPFLAVGFTQSLLAASPVFETVEGIENNLKEKEVNSLIEKIQNTQFETSNLVKGAALFMGIDAMDGTFNTFGALTSLLTMVGVSSSYVIPIAGLVIGGIGGGMAVHSGMQKIEQHRLNQSTYAGRAFAMIAVQQKESVLATLDNVMGKMETTLLNVHSYRNREGTLYGKLDTTSYKVAHIRDIAGLLQGMTYRNELYLG